MGPRLLVGAQCGGARVGEDGAPAAQPRVAEPGQRGYVGFDGVCRGHGATARSVAGPDLVPTRRLTGTVAAAGSGGTTTVTELGLAMA